MPQNSEIQAAGRPPKQDPACRDGAVSFRNCSVSVSGDLSGKTRRRAMADESLEAIQQLRAAIEEQGREIQRLVQRHTQLEQQLHGLGRRGQEALQPEPKAPESHLPGRGNGPRLSLESVKSATPAKAGALPPVAEPLSKRLAKAMPQLRESQESAPSAQPKEGRDVCMDAIDLLDDLPEEAIDEDRQENEDDDIEVQMDVENSRISPPTSFTATFRSWDSLAALLQSAPCLLYGDYPPTPPATPPTTTTATTTTTTSPPTTTTKHTMGTDIWSNINSTPNDPRSLSLLAELAGGIMLQSS